MTDYRHDNGRVINPDLVNERKNSSIDLEEMKLFLGENLYETAENYKKITAISNYYD
jgi:hypothetical protein